MFVLNLASNITESYNQQFSLTELLELLTKIHNIDIEPGKIHYSFCKRILEPSLNYPQPMQ